MTVHIKPYSSLMLLTLLVTAGCGNSSNSHSNHATHAAHTDALQAGHAHHWSCPANPGTPPQGELKAERVTAANSTRTEAGLYEGPVWINDTLYFSDFTFSEGFPSRIQALNPDGTVTTFKENSGSNGLAADYQGNLLIATHSLKGIARYNLETREQQVLADTYQDNRFNSPNDLTLSKKGIFYFTDPDFQRSAAPGGQSKTSVYQFDGTTVTLIDDSLQNPNGISLSPDQKTLYVVGSNVLRAYPIQDGKVGEGKDLAEVTVPDGMAVDCAGNLYVTEHTKQRVRVITPEGKDIAEIKVDANITNAAFGGADRKTLYLTGAGAIWKLDLDIAGFPY